MRARAHDRVFKEGDVSPVRALVHRLALPPLSKASYAALRRLLAVSRLRVSRLIFLLPGQVLLELVTLTAAWIVHGAIAPLLT